MIQQPILTPKAKFPADKDRYLYLSSDTESQKILILINICCPGKHDVADCNQNDLDKKIRNEIFQNSPGTKLGASVNNFEGTQIAKFEKTRNELLFSQYNVKIFFL